MSKFSPSIFFCADSIDLETIPASIGWSSGKPKRVIKLFILSPPNKRIRSSSILTKNWLLPGSPWRPARPRNWLSIRRDSWRSVPKICKPPASLTALASSVSIGLPPSKMSTPRPAMLVARVICFKRPAWDTICASRSWFFAFKISNCKPSCFRLSASNSFLAILTVPINTGWPFLLRSLTSLAMALNFASSVL